MLAEVSTPGSRRRPSWVQLVRRPLGVVTLMAIAGALGCGALVSEDAERQRLVVDRTALEVRIAELERALSAAPAVPTPAPGDRLIVRQFTRAADPALADDVAIELCLEIFDGGDPSAGIPPSLSVTCTPVAAPDDDADPADAIEALVTDPHFDCWAGAVPGTNLPPCWR